MDNIMMAIKVLYLSEDGNLEEDDAKFFYSGVTIEGDLARVTEIEDVPYYVDSSTAAAMADDYGSFTAGAEKVSRFLVYE